MRIIFAGTPEFAVPALESLMQAGLVPVAVLTQPDRPAGRGRQVRESPVKESAKRRDVPVLQPEHLGSEAVQNQLRALDADLMIVAAYGLILPQAVLDIPRRGCWNIHASLLPRWRGAAPIQRAIEAGDEESGVCIMQMEAALDTGPVFACRRTAIAPDETGGSLHDRLAALGAQALMECIRQLQDGSLPEPDPQDEEGASYAKKVEKHEARIDWTDDAAEIERRVRAFVPWPVTWCELGGERLRVWRAEVASNRSSAAAGSVVAAGEDGIEIAAAHGALRLLEVQRAGSRRMSAAAYLRARPLTPGA